MFSSYEDSDIWIGEDMLLINGVVPNEKMGAQIILITCKREDEDKLKEFIRNEDGIVFVFEDEPSMDHFRRLFQESKFYINDNFHLTDLQHIGQSNADRIKFLSYISGIENFTGKKEVLTFLHESTLLENAKEIAKYADEHIWILKDEEDEVSIEGFYVI